MAEIESKKDISPTLTPIPSPTPPLPPPVPMSSEEVPPPPPPIPGAHAPTPTPPSPSSTGTGTGTVPAPPAPIPGTSAPAPSHAHAHALVPSKGQTITIESFKFIVKSFNPDGTSTAIEIPLPTSPNFADWAFTQQVGMLKMGPWNKVSIEQIVFGLAYANHIGAQVLEGELFSTGEGRWGTSNKFKIKRGMKSGRIKGYTIDTHELNDPLPAGMEKCVVRKDLECVVTLDVEGLNKPVVRKARLSRWWNSTNPNWSSKPEHMLELNTLAHAMEFVDPVGTEDDEAAPAAMEAPLPSAKELKEQARRLPPLPSSPSSPSPISVSPTLEPKGENKGGIINGGLDVTTLPDPTEIGDILSGMQEVAANK